jgi:hypothetical protein
MNSRSRFGRTAFGKIATCAALVLGLSGLAWANGEEFFEADDAGSMVLYYFGHVKDNNGKVLDNLLITVSAKNVKMNFPFRNDAPGHFRSPDVGKAIKGLGKSVDTSQIDVNVVKAGYKLSRTTKVPHKMGAVQLEFVMEPVAAAK